MLVKKNLMSNMTKCVNLNFKFTHLHLFYFTADKGKLKVCSELYFIHVMNVLQFIKSENRFYLNHYFECIKITK